MRGQSSCLEEKNKSYKSLMPGNLSVSLVVPLFNESETIKGLVDTIKEQTVLPDEVIFVDGGSADNTIQLVEDLIRNDSRFRILKAGRAMPGQGRNIGAGYARNEWIAFTDAGIQLDSHWLENLQNKAKENPEAWIIWGNYSPQIKNFFDKCATISYVPALKEGNIRGKSIVSCLLKKEVWEKTGGFPNWRAAEDLIFMEKVEKLGYKIAFAPEAMVWWELRKDLPSTYRKFVLYSMHNVWAGRQRYWHYGVARQYLLIVLFVLPGIFHYWLWFCLIPLWLVARVAKKVIQHRYEFKIKTLINPAVWGLVALITFVIDAATFTGWAKAVWGKREGL